MAFGISPYRQTLIPLAGYEPDHYLTLLYNAMVGLGWHISYFNHDGLIAYTNISFESYSEEVSVRIKDNWAIIKSECVGFQALLTDYGKNSKNLRRLFDELEYTDAMLSNNLQEKTQELMDTIAENQFINLEEPPMAGKEKLHDFINAFIPQHDYFITPILVIINTVIYLVTATLLVALVGIMSNHKFDINDNPFEKLYLHVGFSGRASVLHGEVWRLVTNTFLHFSKMHLFGNMIALTYVGSMIESKLGKWNFLLLYLLTGICASVVSVSWHFQGVSGGASGAIFGLFGVLLALASTSFYERNARNAILISTVIMVALNIAPISSRIDNAAHFGGLISGYIFGWIFYLGMANKYSFSTKWSMVVVALITLIFTGTTLKLLPDYKIKEYWALVQKVKSTENSVKKCYYAYAKDSNVKIDSIEQYGFPLLKELRAENKLIKNYPLPSKLKREADYHSKVIDLECQSFDLYYKGLKEENNYDKYKARIDSINNVINDLGIDFEADQ